MTTALDFLDKLDGIDILELSTEAINNTSEQGAEAQTNQLYQGVDKYGYPITNMETGSDEYSPAYSKYKRKKKPIDLLDQGGFYEGITFTVKGDVIDIQSTDWKNLKLQKTYGEEILGLGEKARIAWLKFLRPELMLLIRKKLE